MDTYSKLVTDMKETMKSGDKDKLLVIRGVIAQIKDATINAGKEITEEIVMQTINRGIKQRNDSIESYTKGNRLDLADKEKKELDYLMTFKPKQLNESEVRDIVQKFITENNLTSKKDMGKVMKYIKTSEYSQSIDMSSVSKIVGSILV